MGASTTGAVRVSVVHGDRRVDAALPASVPLVEYAVEVNRALGVAGAARWERLGAGPLDPARGIEGQGVRDGTVLVVLAAEEPGLERFDDLGEAVREVAAAEFARWPTAWTPATLGLVAALAGALAALLLPLLGRGATAVVALPTALVVLLVAGVRARAARSGVGEEVVAVALAGLHAVVGALALLPPGSTGATRDSPTAWALVGVALVGLGLLAAGCLHRARWVAVVPSLLGVVAGAAGWVAAHAGVDPGVVLMLAASTSLLVARALPGAVLEATVVRGDSERVGAADTDRLRRDLHLAHAVVLCLGVVQVVLVLVALAYAVGRGLPGVVWASLPVTLLALRCRHEVVRSHAVLGAVGATAAAVVLVMSPVVLLPGAAPGAVVAALVVAGAAVCVRDLSPRSSPRLAWALDALERLVVMALLPGLVVVSGVVPGWR